MPRGVEIKLISILQILMVVVLIMLGYFSIHREVLLSTRLLRQETFEQSNKIDALSRVVQDMRQQQYVFCVQYEIDMDRYFRDHPEFKKHPWVCSPENKQ